MFFTTTHLFFLQSILYSWPYDKIVWCVVCKKVCLKKMVGIVKFGQPPLVLYVLVGVEGSESPKVNGSKQHNSHPS